MEDHEFDQHLAGFKQRARGLLGTMVAHQKRIHEARLAQSGISDRGVSAQNIIGQMKVHGGLTMAAKSSPVAVAAGAGLPVFAFQDSQIDSIHLAVNAAPTGSELVVAVRKNGTEITDPANRPSIADGALSGKGDGEDMLDQTVAAGDRFTFDVISVGSTTPGADLVVAIKLRVGVHRGGAAL